MERVTQELTLPYVKQIANGNLLYETHTVFHTQETQTGAMYQPRGVEWGRSWEEGSKGRGNIYTYG